MIDWFGRKKIKKLEAEIAKHEAIIAELKNIHSQLNFINSKINPAPVRVYDITAKHLAQHLLTFHKKKTAGHHGDIVYYLIPEGEIQKVLKEV